MNKISDYDFRRISSFIDGELDHDQIVLLMTDMKMIKSLKKPISLLLKLVKQPQNSKPRCKTKIKKFVPEISS
ncbi:MAG: hypothetical protein CM15mP127_14900 [Gammaproteobacteria bacterium]|nr:MAG: hypothetical protein CM15mP127_14900 [Gammaproteobacteria bacterium]